MNRTPIYSTKRSGFPFQPSGRKGGRTVGGLTVACLVIFAHLAIAAVPVLPTEVPYDQLTTEPYRHVGLVRTDSYGDDPTVLGSGWVADERVVASAGHVFFVDETLGWNRNRWYWRRAAPPGGYWYTHDMIAPRAYRVLAGYAAAAARTVTDPNAERDALNRDAIALLFYRPVSDTPAPPRARSALLGSGTYTIVGYPAVLGTTPVPDIAMYAHLGGHAATYTATPGATDSGGNPNMLFQTSDITGGPGGSGGPVFKQISGTWTVVGSLLAGLANQYSVARAIDDDLEAMLAAANADSVATGPGVLLWERPGTWGIPPVFRADGSAVLVLNSDTVAAVDGKGVDLWRQTLPNITIAWIAEAPDGRIVVGAIYNVVSLEGTTGRELWRTAVPFAQGGAVGEVGEVYVSADLRVARISPSGVLTWDKQLPTDNLYQPGKNAPAIGADGTIFLLSQDRLYAIDRENGAVKWRTVTLPSAYEDSLTLASDGSITLVSATAITRWEPDGSLRWLYPTPNGVGPRPFVRPDGSVVVINNSANGLIVLNPDGTLKQTIPLEFEVIWVTGDASGRLYVGLQNSTIALNPSGTQLWRNDAAGGRLYVGPSNYILSTGYQPLAWSAIGADGPVGAETWQPVIGGVNAARRVANSGPVAPKIISPPEAARIVTGYRLELAVTAEGSFPLNFEWRRNGILLPDQIGRRLIIRETNAVDAGDYTVTVRNLAGSVTSAPVSVLIGSARFGDQLWATSLRTDVIPAIAADGSVYVLAHGDDVANPYAKIVWLVALDSGGNERWRRELIREQTSIWASPPVIGDDGRIHVAVPGRILAFSTAGAELWRYDYPSTTTGDWPNLALARDNGVFFSAFRRLGALTAAGARRWEKTELSTYGPMLVRRDGALVIGPGSIITPEGILRNMGSTTVPGTFGFLGPNDELVMTTTYDGGATINRDGVVIARNPASIYDQPLFLLSDATVVTDRLRFEPFMGTGSRDLGIYGIAPAAILTGDRLLLLSDAKARVIDRNGATLAESTNVHGLNYAVGPGGVLIGGWPLAAYNIDWSPSNTAWPLRRADSCNTSRGPENFVLTTGAISSATLRGRTDPSDRYEPWIQYQTAAMTGHVGYSARLTVGVYGSGPFTFRWERNGQEITAATGGEVVFSALQPADAGVYAVAVSNATGTIYSTALTLTVESPAPASPGTYVRTWIDPYTNQSWPCLFEVTGDRYVKVTLIDQFGLQSRVRLNPDGTFIAKNLAREYSGTLIGATMTLGSATPLAATPAALSGFAPNGVPAGIYRGHLLGPTARPVTLLVFADGSFAWVRAMLNGYSSTAGGVLAANALTGSFTERSGPGSVAYQYTARADGAIVGTAQGNYLDHTGFVAVWNGRPEIERLVNLSTRGYVSPTHPPMIAGFIVNGSTPHAFLLRAAGPALTGFGVQGPLAHPRIRLVDGAGTELRQGTAWSLDPAANQIRDTSLRLGAFAFPDGSEDAAVVTTVAPGAYTALVDGTDGGAGVALVEVYEDPTTSGGGSRLRNLSTRGLVAGGERVLIGGFVVEGVVPKSMLIRAAGPSLAQFVNGAFDVASDPRLQIFRQNGPVPIATNDNIWVGGNEPEVIDAARRLGAFALLGNDAALVLALPPGVYTAVVDNVTPDEGVALLEIYELPAQ